MYVAANLTPYFCSGFGNSPSVFSSTVLSPVSGSAGLSSSVFLSSWAKACTAASRHPLKTTAPKNQGDILRGSGKWFDSENAAGRQEGHDQRRISRDLCRSSDSCFRISTAAGGSSHLTQQKHRRGTRSLIYRAGGIDHSAAPLPMRLMHGAKPHAASGVEMRAHEKASYRSEFTSV
jgi:hypothetical protein